MTISVVDGGKEVHVTYGMVYTYHMNMECHV